MGEGDHVLFLRSQDPELAEFVKARLRYGGLEVEVVESPEEGSVALILSVSQAKIRLEAEAWTLLKTSNNECKEYVAADHDTFTPSPLSKDGDGLFTPSEICFITHEIIARVRVGVVPDCMPRSEQGVLPRDSLMLALERAQVGEMWPVHMPASHRKAAWKKGIVSADFPTMMEHYYGPNVAFYFAWLKHYTIWLTLPAIAGFLVWLYHYLNPDISADNSHVLPLFTLLVIVWAMAYVKSWDRHSASLVCDWGISDIRWRREVRPEYRGEKRISPVTGHTERYSPMHKRLLMYTVSVLVTLLMLCVAFSVMVISLNLQGYIHHSSYSRNYLLYPSISWLCDDGEYFDPRGSGPMPWLLLYIPVIFHVAIIRVLNIVYSSIATRLTDAENHRSPSDHENALYIKRFLFEAFDCYIALFYLGFIERDIVLLRRELVSLYTVDSIRRITTETLLPFITRKATRGIARVRGEKEEERVHERLAKDLDKEQYEQFDDYLEIVIQIGYVTLFAGAFPLAAPLSVLCNVLELYSDVFKLGQVTRRPTVHRITDIGVWTVLSKGLILLSIFTNIYIFCFTSEQLMNYAPSLFDVIELSPEAALKAGSDHVHEVGQGAGITVATIMAVLEHCLLLTAAIVWVIVPAVPGHVKDELSRREYVKFIETHGELQTTGLSSTTVATEASR